MACKITIGVDEVGVGPLAGPVTACALTGPAIRKPIRDSKKLSAKQREEFFRIFCKDASIKWALASIMPKTIDRINIFQARRLAMKRAVEKLLRKIAVTPGNGRGYLVLIDGNVLLNTAMNERAIIKGDEKVAIIGTASIIAKISRDRMMARYHKKYPEYRFDLHKGYGTKLHYEMLREHGPCPIHRRSFRLG
ncbi:MAG: ribonuclease HII [Candidatus Spechtbacteria bacterium]|nr:ribonuclease HII [Candidatus Spechtbacteria bacterium]